MNQSQRPQELVSLAEAIVEKLEAKSFAIQSSGLKVQGVCTARARAAGCRFSGRSGSALSVSAAGQGFELTICHLAASMVLVFGYVCVLLHAQPFVLAV